MGAADGHPTYQAKTDGISNESVSPGVPDEEKALNEDCCGIAYLDEKDLEGRDNTEAHVVKEDDIIPTISDIGKPLEDESWIQRIRDFFSFKKDDELNSENGDEINCHESDKGDILPTIGDIGKPIEQSLLQKGKEWFEEKFSDTTDTPSGSRNNDPLPNSEEKLGGAAGSDQDVVDGKFEDGMTETGISYRKKLRSRQTMNKVTTTHTTFQPKINKKSWWQKIFQKKGDDEVDSPPQQTESPMKSCYDMSCLPRGVFILINMRDFAFNKKWKRIGTDKDAESLTELFLELGFQVERFDNPSANDINEIMDQRAKADYSKKGCFACAILSHGDNGIFYAKDTYVDVVNQKVRKVVNIDDVLRKFENKRSTGIPKFFMIQACRGVVYMDQMGKFNEANNATMVQDYELSLPGDSDFLCVYSTPPGYYSWRRENSKDAENIGSWFVQDLVEVFQADAHKSDVLSMLTRVNQKVADRFSSISEDHPDYERAHKRKGIPSFQCQLTKDLFFYPPFGPNK